VQYDLNRNLGVRLLWQRYETDEAIDLLAAGVTYRFWAGSGDVRKRPARRGVFIWDWWSVGGRRAAPLRPPLVRMDFGPAAILRVG